MLKAVLAVYHNHILSLISTINAVTAPDASPPSAFDPASRPALQRFIRKRIKLVRNIMLWRRQAPEEVRELVNLVVGNVLRPLLERCWGSGGQEMAPKVSVLSTWGTTLIGQIFLTATGLLSPQLAVYLQRGPR